MFVLALLIAAGVWEAVKALVPGKGLVISGVPILPRTTDAAMPHLYKVFEEFGKQEVSLAGSSTVISSVFTATLYSLRLALGGFLIGAVIGLLLALVMDRFRVAERAVLPWVVLSQTVPIVAFAPLVTGWGSDLKLGSLDWQQWMSVCVIAAYLAFFPISVGMLRGLKAPTSVHTELFRCYATGWWSSLLRLKLPASVPFLIPALKLGAAASVVGAVVAEFSIGARGGIGRLILDYSQSSTGDPSRLYTAVIGAAAMGLIAAAIVSVLDVSLRRYQTSEER
jgi:NitT/TauT family transport system permease protein